MRATPNVFFICSLLVLAILGCGLLLTSLPLCDEGYYGIPAYFLATEGVLKSPVMETAGVSVMTGIHQALYWMAPAGMVIQAAAFKLFGSSLYVERCVSLSAAFATLLCWFQVVRRLLTAQIAGLACLVLSCDLVFVSLAVRGRSDMLSLCFGTAALAAYLALRGRSIPLALLAGNTGCAISGMIHPNGGLAALLSLSIVVVYLDRSRLRWAYLPAILLPYGIGAAGWGIWISKHPAYFVDQFLGNVRNRAAKTLIETVRGEARRYLIAFGFETGSFFGVIRAAIPLAYLAALAGCVRFRRAIPNISLFFLLACAQALLLLFFEGAKQGPYLVHSIPVLATFVAAWMLQLLSWKDVWPGRIALLAQAAVPITVFIGLLVVVSERHYQSWYLPAVHFVNANVTPGKEAIVASDFFFNLDCRTCMIDDRHLGAYSGRKPDFMVLDYDYFSDIGVFEKADPKTYTYIHNLLTKDYSVVFQNPAFQIFRRNSSALPSY